MKNLITELEGAVMIALWESDFRDGEEISCWSSEIHWTLAKYIDRTSIPGIVASLSKKELIEIHDQRDPQNTWISFTAKGLEIFKQTFYYNNVYLPLT